MILRRTLYVKICIRRYENNYDNNNYDNNNYDYNNSSFISILKFPSQINFKYV